MADRRSLSQKIYPFNELDMVSMSVTIISMDNKAEKQYQHSYQLNRGKLCVDCGKPITMGHQRCKSCNGRYLWKAGRLHLRELTQRGNLSPAWKGGLVRRRGYLMRYMPDHPRAKSEPYVMEHILVWEEANGRLLPEGWVVHHINGVKDDNRRENLTGMPKRGHSPWLFVKIVQARVRELEVELIIR